MNRALAAVRRARPSTWGWVAAFTVAYLATYPLSDYQLFQLSRVTTTAVAVVGLVLLTGLSGQVSAGQGAAFGLGAYACAILVVRGLLPWPAAVLAAGLVACAAGLVLGLPALRLGPLNLALVTLSVAVVLPLVAARWESLTGGPFGLSVPAVRTPAGIRLSSAQFLYLVTLAVLAATVAWARWWTSGRTGRALAALRTDPLMARTAGVDTARLSVLVVGLGSGLAGVAGALNALVVRAVVPDAYTFVLSLALLTGAVVGGIRSWAGAVAGAAYIVYLPDVASSMVGTSAGGNAAELGYAATLLLTLYVAPQGLAGLAARLAASRGRRGAPAGTAAGGTPAAERTASPPSVPQAQHDAPRHHPAPPVPSLAPHGSETEQ